MSYQNKTGPLMANSHPGSYCGQDAYSDLLITEEQDGRIYYGNGSGQCRNNAGGCPTLNTVAEQPIYANDKKYAARRLTPIECARLQGFPDGWCDDVPHSDSAEYKLWGNGIALPCLLPMMKTMAEILEGEPQ